MLMTKVKTSQLGEDKPAPVSPTHPSQGLLFPNPGCLVFLFSPAEEGRCLHEDKSALLCQGREDGAQRLDVPHRIGACLWQWGGWSTDSWLGYPSSSLSPLPNPCIRHLCAQGLCQVPTVGGGH
jgi:hypothetical protein